MKSCLVPPNLKNAGVSALANVLSFGDLVRREEKCNIRVESHPIKEQTCYYMIWGSQVLTCEYEQVTPKATNTKAES